MDSDLDHATDVESDYFVYYYDFYYYTSIPQNLSVPPSMPPPHLTSLNTDVISILLATVSVIIMVLGLTGNGLVIWIAGFKIKKKVNTVWYLSLAVSDFLFCAFLPFFIFYIVKRDWVFGSFMCKFTFFLLSLNMFSSIFLLVIITVDRCVVVMFPVWAQNKRTIRRALVMVLLAWILSALLSLPVAIFREVEIVKSKHSCYMHDEQYLAVVVCRIIFGFVIPLLIIIVCYGFIIRKMKNNQMTRSNKPFKVMTALIAAFFICWMPYHFFYLLKLSINYTSVIRRGQIFGLILASANSFMNPLLYASMRKDFRREFCALLSKIESTFEEEVQSTLRATSVTNSGDGRHTSTV